MASGSVLVLNATYEPINVVPLRRAVILLLKEKAEIVEAVQGDLCAQNCRLVRPSVIRLVYYVKIPRFVGVPLSRRTVMARDYYTCQYCGARPERADLTIDHVLPRSKGGETSWENVVTACRRCNARKGNRTLEEARMTLKHPPSRPRYVAFALMTEAAHDERWRKYMY